MLDLAWYCPSEGDGRLLGTRRPERAPDIDYLLQVVRAAERAGAREMLVPTGLVNDSFAPDAPFMESWTTASALAARTRASGSSWRSTPRVSRPASRPTRRRRWGAWRRGASPSTWSPAAVPTIPTAAPLRPRRAVRAPRRSGGALRSRFGGPLYLGGASEAAKDLAARVADTYLMWGEPPEDDRGARRGDAGPCGPADAHSGCAST